MTSIQDIVEWLEEGKEDRHRWLLVVCDSFSHENYPVYADTAKEFYEQYDKYDGKNMQRIMESYDISADWKPQLAQVRSNAKPTK
jgi:protoheme ferro-lyase